MHQVIYYSLSVCSKRRSKVLTITAACYRRQRIVALFGNTHVRRRRSLSCFDDHLGAPTTTRLYSRSDGRESRPSRRRDTGVDETNRCALRQHPRSTATKSFRLRRPSWVADNDAAILSTRRSRVSTLTAARYRRRRTVAHVGDASYRTQPAADTVTS